MWNNAFKVISVIPILGVIVIRIIEVFTVSKSIVLTVCFAMISAMLGGIFLAVMNSARAFRVNTGGVCFTLCVNEDIVHSLHT